jgi:3-oxoacyl-[acyl-carrier protein] reductase/pteridine reductase
VDILVNNASLFQTTPVPTSDFTAWRRVTRILVDGAFYCANAFAPEMRRRGRGVIINLIDLSARQPFPRFAAHSVGKAGLEALTRQLALELSPEVRVNAIAPGPVLPPPGYSPEKIARAARHTLLGRWGSPGDVADAVLFLIRSDYITGITLTVDGGEHLARYKDPD